MRASVVQCEVIKEIWFSYYYQTVIFIAHLSYMKCRLIAFLGSDLLSVKCMTVTTHCMILINLVVFTWKYR